MLWWHASCRCWASLQAIHNDAARFVGNPVSTAIAACAPLRNATQTKTRTRAHVRAYLVVHVLRLISCLLAPGAERTEAASQRFRHTVDQSEKVGLRLNTERASETDRQTETEADTRTHTHAHTRTHTHARTRTHTHVLTHSRKHVIANLCKVFGASVDSLLTNAANKVNCHCMHA